MTAEEEQIFLRAIEGGLVDDLLDSWKGQFVRPAADASTTAYARLLALASTTAYARLLALVDRTPGSRAPEPEGAIQLAPDEWYSARWRTIRDAISERVYGTRTLRVGGGKVGVK